MNSFEKLKEYLEKIIKSYDELKKMESYGGDKELLRKELIQIRDICDELPALVGEITKEMNLQIDKIESWIGILKPTFLTTLKMQIVLLSEPNTPNNDATVRLQASMSVALISDYIQGCKLINAFLK